MSTEATMISVIAVTGGFLIVIIVLVSVFLHKKGVIKRKKKNNKLNESILPGPDVEMINKKY